MSAGVMVLLAAAAVVFVLAPLRRPAPPPASEDARTGLLRSREAAYQALQDADFDHATGKMSDADYADLQARHTARAQAILRRLDALDGGDGTSGGASA